MKIEAPPPIWARLTVSVIILALFAFALVGVWWTGSQVWNHYHPEPEPPPVDALYIDCTMEWLQKAGAAGVKVTPDLGIAIRVHCLEETAVGVFNPDDIHLDAIQNPQKPKEGK